MPKETVMKLPSRVFFIIKFLSWSGGVRGGKTVETASGAIGGGVSHQ